MIEVAKWRRLQESRSRICDCIMGWGRVVRPTCASSFGLELIYFGVWTEFRAWYERGEVSKVSSECAPLKAVKDGRNGRKQSS